MNKRKALKREIDKVREGVCVDRRNDGDSSGREEIVEGEGVEVRTGAKLLFCGDGVGEKKFFALTDENWFTGSGGRGGREKRY